MKPTLPEDREIDEMGAEVSARYRAGAQDEPPAKLDAAILAAARREVRQPRPRRNWQMPVSIAAMLVISVSLVLIVRDVEPPLPTMDQPAAGEARLAKPAPPQLAMRAQPRAKADFYREGRPSRERSGRPDREPPARDEMAVAQAPANAASGASVQSAPLPPAPAAPALTEQASPAEQEEAPFAESGKVAPARKIASMADAVPAVRGNVQALRKKEESASAQNPARGLAGKDRHPVAQRQGCRGARTTAEFPQAIPDLSPSRTVVGPAAAGSALKIAPAFRYPYRDPASAGITRGHGNRSTSNNLHRTVGDRMPPDPVCQHGVQRSAPFESAQFRPRTGVANRRHLMERRP